MNEATGVAVTLFKDLTLWYFTLISLFYLINYDHNLPREGVLEWAEADSFGIKHRLTIAYHPVPSYQETQDEEVFGKDNWRGPCALQVQDPELPSDSWNGSGISTAFSIEASSTFSDYTLTKLR